MAEEQQVPEKEVTSSEVVQEVSIDDRARDMGWKPKEEFKGDPNDWRSAETFVAMDPLFKRIEEEKRARKAVESKLSHMEQKQQDIQKFMQTVRESEYKNALAALKAEKKAALSDGEHDRVVEIDERIADVREQQKLDTVSRPERIVPDQSEINAEIEAFVERNKWYNADEDMQVWANAKAVALSKRGIHGVTAIREIEKQVKEVFPQKFRNSNRDKPSSVEGPSAAGTTKSASHSLPDDVKQIMKRTIASTPGMTEEKWMKSYTKAQGGRA